MTVESCDMPSLIFIPLALDCHIELSNQILGDHLRPQIVLQLGLGAIVSLYLARTLFLLCLLLTSKFSSCKLACLRLPSRLTGCYTNFKILWFGLEGFLAHFWLLSFHVLSYVRLQPWVVSDVRKRCWVTYSL